VPAGTEFDCHILVENAEGWQLGMLFVGLQEFVDGRVALGGGRSRGLGAVRLDLAEKTLVEKEDLLAYLAGEGGRLVKDEEIRKWRGEFIARLKKEASHAQKAD
jgi:CRISPR/Cas system CSM-associated protein Csm3 (group 7 of RAMP superfamily)